jgi:predicted dehydrogenase
MNVEKPNQTSRRDFLKTTGTLVAASSLAGIALPHVHAASTDTIQVALIGCGGRGTGAIHEALSTTSGPIKLVAMADVFDHRLKGSYKNLKDTFHDKVDVSEERKFVGFDGYKKAMDCLKPGDVAVFATPPAFRWVHFGYAIEKGLNVFMEKPVTIDGPTSRKMFKLGEESVKKGLKVGVGLMCRHCKARQELHDRIKDGQIGDIILLRAYRMAGATGSAACPPKPANKTDLMYQIERFHGFLWSGGGAVSDFLIHNIDECSWMKDAFPTKAQASGGRHYRGDCVDQNFDTYSVEYTYADGAKLYLEGRCIEGCFGDHSSYAHGSKGSAIISTGGHMPSHASLYKGQTPSKDSGVIWQFEGPEPNPYQLEWDHLIAAIRNNTPYNETQRGVQASLVTSMGRMAAHTGQIITYEQILNSTHEFAPAVNGMGYETPAPLQPDAKGKYPIPEPGIKKDREY